MPPPPPTNADSSDTRCTPAWLELVAVALPVAFFAVLGTLYARVPPSPDQFEIQYVAWAWAQGDRLYTDIIDMNWPGIFALMRPIAGLPFDPWFPWRIVDFFLMLAAVLATARWIRISFGPAASLLWCVIYPLVYTSPALYWFAGQPDAVMFHVVLLAVLAHQHAWFNKPGRSKRYAAIVGALFGLAALVKPTALVFAIAIVAHAFISTRPEKNLWHQPFAYAAVAALAGLLTLALGFAAVLLDGTPPKDASLAAWTYNQTAQFQGALPTHELVAQGLAELARFWHLAWPIIFLGLPVACLRFPAMPNVLVSSRRSDVALISTLGLAAFAAFLLQGKGFTYHLAPASAVVALAFAAAMATLWHARPKQYSFTLTHCLVIVCVLPLLATKAWQHRPSLQSLAGSIDRPTYLERFQAGDQLTFNQLNELDQTLTPLLNQHPDAPLLLFGESAVNNLRHQRAMPTRFYYFLTLTNLRPSMPMHDDWLDRFAQDLQTTQAIGLISNQALDLARKANNGSHKIIQAWLDQQQTVAVFNNFILTRPTPLPSPPTSQADAPATPARSAQSP